MTQQHVEIEVDSDTGLVHAARMCESPNCDDRPADAELLLVVLHGISLPPGKFGGSEIEDFFCNRLDCAADPFFGEIEDLRVSAHMLIRRDGELLQFVALNRRAWHAGQSVFRGRKDCNDFSIGIELEGDDDTPYDDRQYDVLARLLTALFASYPGLNLRRVAGHCDVSPGRKTDPGPVFDWLRLYDDVSKRADS